MAGAVGAVEAEQMGGDGLVEGERGAMVKDPLDGASAEVEGAHEAVAARRMGS